MRKIFFSLIFLLILAIPAFSQNIKVAGIASKGGKIVRTSANTQHIVMETFPSSTITVYLTGTLTLAPIFSDEIGTPKANPFTAGSDASYSFYVAVGRYDIKFSGTGILTPFTLSDIFVNASGGGGSAGVESFNARTGVVIPQPGDYTFAGLNFVGSNFNSIETRSASDLSSGTLPDARFPAILPALSGINLTNLNASNLSSGTVDDVRLSANIPKKDGINIFTQNNLFTANVGIGSLVPARKLEVLDGSNAQLRLTSIASSAFTDLFVDSGGTLNILPSGNVAFDTVGNQVNPLNTFDQNLGQINKKWLSLHAAELFVETLVAQNTIATIGGRIIIAPSNILIADLPSASATINVKYNNLNNGDRIYFEGNSSVEFMAVTSGATVISGGFSYTVTRNLDATGANDWFAGDALVNTGVSGDGFIDLYSLRGVKSATQIGPTIVGNVRNSTTFNDWSENWAIGNLNGLYGYGGDIFGVALGKYSAGSNHITIDSTSGIRILNGLSTVRATWAITGDLGIGTEAVGQSNIFIANTGRLSIRNNVTERIRLDTDGSGFLANNLIAWDASGNLTITDANLRLVGATSSFAIGVTPPTSSSSGTGIWIDRTGFYGLSSNVVQTRITSTGTITAGAGKTILDSRGVNIIANIPLADSDFVETSAVNFRDNNTLVSALYHSISTTKASSILFLETVPYAGLASNIRIQSNSSVGQDSRIHLSVFVDGVSNSSVILRPASLSSSVPLHLGGSSFSANGSGISFSTASVNPTMSINSAGLFAKDVAGTTEMFSIDEAGNVTQISPHEPNSDKWIFYSCNQKTGRCIKVDMEKLVNTVEDLSGEKLMNTWEEK